MIRKIYLVLIFAFASNISIIPQVSNVKLDHDVYDYLSILSQKGIIEYKDLVKPLSRRYVAEKLIEAGTKKIKLTKLQKEELKFYKAEFGYEIERINSEFGIQDSELRESVSEQPNQLKNKTDENEIDGEPKKLRDLTDKSWEFETRKPLKQKVESNENLVKKESQSLKGEEIYTFAQYDPYSRWRVFAYQNNLMNLNVNPILGYKLANWEKENYRSLFAGINFNGEIGNVVGFNFELRTQRLEPGYIRGYYLFNEFTPNTTIDIQLADRERVESTTINVDLGAEWEWGSFTIGKNHLNWGYAENGKIVLSEKAPSFPYIRLDISPTDWLSFNYIHAWLNSDVYDTSSFHSTWRYREWSDPDKKDYIGKYIAMHSVTFSFWNGLDLSLGESIVYSGNLQLAFLIPIMFFDIADEYISRNDNYSGGSTQLFLSASSRNHIPNTHLYASFHADELTPEGLFDPETQYYKMAFTFGGYVIDLPIPNLGVRLEYTKIYPGNYRHFVPSLTYESSSSLMGHWMGDNGDLFYAAIDYTVFRGLKIKLWTQHIRKGTEALGNRAYKIQIPQPGFLFTDNIQDRKNYAYYGVNVDYEFMHDVWVKAHYQYIDYKQQVEEDIFKSTLYRDMAITLGYGI